MKLRPQAACPAPQGFATHEEQVKFMKMSNELSSEEKYDRDFSEMRNIEMMWWKIHSRAQTNEGLKDLLDRAIVYYRLLEETDTGGNDGAGCIRRRAMRAERVGEVVCVATCYRK